MTHKIDRALIIRRKKVKLSRLYAKECAKSCEEHDLPYEFVNAIEFMGCPQAFKQVGSFIKNNYKNTQGNCCCHASHIKCWKRIVEIDKPCIILEHDAIVRGRVQDIEIPEMAVTTFGHRVLHKNDYTPVGPAQKMVQIERAIGVHACGLTPKTAAYLDHEACTNGVGIGVDRWLMMKRASGLPLYVCDPPQVVCWERRSTSNMKMGEADAGTDTEPNRKKVHNYPDALTASWKAGFKKS